MIPLLLDVYLYALNRELRILLRGGNLASFEVNDLIFYVVAAVDVGGKRILAALKSGICLFSDWNGIPF